MKIFQRLLLALWLCMICTAVYSNNKRNHFGNNCVVANDNGNAGQVNNYYPFGGEFTAISTNTELHPWTYTGKEYDHRHGLDLYDFGARMYPHAALLWTSVDSRAEDYYDVSPYF